MNDGANPLPEEPRAARERLRRVWSWVFATPLIYALIAWGLLSLRLVAGPGAGVHPWDTPAARWTIGGLAGVVFVFAIVFRALRRAAVRAALPDRAAALRRYSWNFFTTLALADTLSFLGLVYFIVSGRLSGILAGGLLTFIGYFLAYPRAGDLDELE